MRFHFPPLVEGVFLKRINRFIAQVELNGEVLEVHVPSTGRLDSLLFAGVTCYLKPSENPKRKTAYSLYLVKKDQEWVCIDALLANLFAEGLLRHGLVPNIPTGLLQAEVSLENSRFDFRIIDEEGHQHMIEVKSVNLVDEGKALFPDAPTTRGTKHLHELAKLQEEGVQTHILFIIQRGDAKSFSPHDQIDPLFSTALRNCVVKGSNVQIAGTKVTPHEIKFQAWLPLI